MVREPARRRRRRRRRRRDAVGLRAAAAAAAGAAARGARPCLDLGGSSSLLVVVKSLPNPGSARRHIASLVGRRESRALANAGSHSATGESRSCAARDDMIAARRQSRHTPFVSVDRRARSPCRSLFLLLLCVCCAKTTTERGAPAFHGMYVMSMSWHVMAWHIMACHVMCHVMHVNKARPLHM